MELVPKKHKDKELKAMRDFIANAMDDAGPQHAKVLAEALDHVRRMEAEDDVDITSGDPFRREYQ